MAATGQSVQEGIVQQKLGRASASLVFAVAAIASQVFVGAQGPALEEHLGKVHFETSCASGTAATFDRAMALLHSFEFPEATAGFREVEKADSTCGIAEWGVAMSAWGNPFSGLRAPRVIQTGLEAVGRARAMGAKTDRERAYIEAVALLYSGADAQDQRARTLAYEHAMEQIHATYPNDLEATVFYALAIDQDALPGDKTYTNQLKAAALLEDLFKVEPDHPGVTHYLIHSYDVPALADRGLPYARRYANLAPDAPHALHMPSHTFTRVGLWQESIDTNIRSHDVAIAARNPGEALHAMDYMTYAYLQTGQDAAARRVVDELAGMIASDAGTGPGLAGGFPGTAIPARYALERGQWADAAALPVHATQQPYVEAMTHFARALGAAKSGRAAAMKADVDALTELREKEVQAKDEYWTTQIDIERQEAGAWQLWVEGQKDAALKALAAAAALEDTTEKSVVTPGPLAPAHELLGDMLVEANRPADALREYDAGLTKEPNRYRSLYGAAHAAELAGNRQQARARYEQLLKICERADNPGRPELTHARSYLSSK
jgi:tetratricopeptide (TPR) repeat protein